MMLHDTMGSDGGMASSLGRGSLYEETEIRWLLPSRATKPVL
jgi:hypothetical protein